LPAPVSSTATISIFVDHYTVLGVEPTANPDVIKKAYHQLALQHHPDKAAPGGEADAAKFISALASYEILIDVSKRKVYDVQYKKLYSIDPFSKTVPRQATQATHFPQRETDGSYGGGFWSHPARHGEEMDIGEDYPSDNESDLGSGYDTGVYEDGYADPHYEPEETSNDVDTFDGNDVYRSDFDATDNRHQFPPESVDDDASPEPDQGGADDEAGAGSADHHRGENPAPKISHPVAEAFDQFHFSDLSKSHWQEEKVKGRYYSKHSSQSCCGLRPAVFRNAPLFQVSWQEANTHAHQRAP
jgi:curved DNA-binding protein CbpA